MVHARLEAVGHVVDYVVEIVRARRGRLKRGNRKCLRLGFKQWPVAVDASATIMETAGPGETEAGRAAPVDRVIAIDVLWILQNVISPK